jgi:hypothetical protein
MPYLVNGQPIPEDRVRGEEVRLCNDPPFDIRIYVASMLHPAPPDRRNYHSNPK